MRKIAAILSSPNVNGNSETIVNAITDGAMGLSTNEFEIIRLNKMRFAKGCQACQKCKVVGKCAVNDDIWDVLETIRNFDSVIISTPLYFGEACSQYRTLADRFYSFINADGSSNLEPGKKVAVVVTCNNEIESASALADKIENLFIESFKFVSAGKIIFCDHGKKNAAKNDTEILSRARSIGKNL